MDKFDNFKFAFPLYKTEKDDVKEQFQKLKNNFKIRYKGRKIKIKEIDEETFLIETGDIVVVYTIISNMIYQMFYN